MKLKQLLNNLGKPKKEYEAYDEAFNPRELPDTMNKHTHKIDPETVASLLFYLVMNSNPNDVDSYITQHELIVLKELIDNDCLLLESEFESKLPLIKTSYLVDDAISKLENKGVVEIIESNKQRVLSINKELIKELLEA